MSAQASHVYCVGAHPGCDSPRRRPTGARILRYLPAILSTLPICAFFIAACAIHLSPALAIVGGLIGVTLGCAAALVAIRRASPRLLAEGHYPVRPLSRTAGVTILALTFLAAVLGGLLVLSLFQGQLFYLVGLVIMAAFGAGCASMALWAWRLERRTGRRLVLLPDGLHLI